MRRGGRNNDDGFHVGMQLAEILIGSGLAVDVLPGIVGVEPFRVVGLVGCRHGVRLVVVVNEGYAVANMDLGRRRIVLEVLDVNRQHRRQERRRGCGVRAGAAECEGERDERETRDELVHGWPLGGWFHPYYAAEAAAG